MVANDDIWAELRRCFETTDEPVPALAERFGININTLRSRIRNHGWSTAVRAAKPATKASRAARSPRTGTRSARAARDKLVGRFYRAISAKLDQWECRIVEGVEIDATERDRLMKELTSMIQGFEKVADVAAGAEKRDEQQSDKRPRLNGVAETTRMRNEIAERLERLARSRDAAAGSGDAEGSGRRSDPE